MTDLKPRESAGLWYKTLRFFEPIRMHPDRLSLSFYLKARDQIEWFRDECTAGVGGASPEGDRPIHLVWRYTWGHDPETHYSDHLLKQWEFSVNAIAAYLSPEHCQKPGDLLFGTPKGLYVRDRLQVQMWQRVPRAQLLSPGGIPAIGPPPKVLMFHRRDEAIGDEFLGTYWELEPA